MEEKDSEPKDQPTVGLVPPRNGKSWLIVVEFLVGLLDRVISEGNGKKKRKAQAHRPDIADLRASTIIPSLPPLATIGEMCILIQNWAGGIDFPTSLDKVVLPYLESRFQTSAGRAPQGSAEDPAQPPLRPEGQPDPIPPHAAGQHAEIMAMLDTIHNHTSFYLRGPRSEGTTDNEAESEPEECGILAIYDGVCQVASRINRVLDGFRDDHTVPVLEELNSLKGVTVASLTCLQAETRATAALAKEIKTQGPKQWSGIRLALLSGGRSVGERTEMRILLRVRGGSPLSGSELRRSSWGSLRIPARFLPAPIVREA